MKSSKKNTIFWLIAVALPFLFFVLLEFGLRGIGYGKSISLFIENPSAKGYMLPRPDVVKRYFHDDENAPNVTIETNFFKKQKPEHGIRVFVQGGSTAAGFPYGYSTSIAGMLDYRLKQTFPERDVEVINTALSAVNSYTVLDFVDEIIEQKPDAVLIYAGHNEYLGILGVGSAYTAANSRAATLMYLKLKDLRIFQLLQQVYSLFSASELHSAPDSQSRTVMAKVAKHKNIAMDSDMFQQGAEQFEQNMQLVLAKYRKAGIPVLISTIASNLSHQPPFSSVPVTNDLVDIVKQGAEKLSVDDVTKLEQYVSTSSNADIHFLLAQYYLNSGRPDQAKFHFELAKEHDLLRFRAPEVQNRTIRQLAEQEGVYLVDSLANLERAAPSNIIGDTLMIEHLHPTIKGYAVISDSFYKAIEDSGVLGEFTRNVSDFSAYKELPIFAAEKYWGEAKIAGLMADYPFTDKPQTPVFKPIKNWSDKLGFAAYKKQASWLQIAQTSLQYAQQQGDTITQLKAVKLLSDAIPNDANLAYQAGTELIKLGRAIEAPRYLKRTLAQEPQNTNAMLALAHAYVQQKKYKVSLNYLDKVLALQPDNPVARKIIPQLRARLANP